MDSLIDSVSGKFFASADGILLRVDGRGKSILQTESKSDSEVVFILKIICPLKGHESYGIYLIPPKYDCPKSLKAETP